MRKLIRLLVLAVYLLDAWRKLEESHRSKISKQIERLERSYNGTQEKVVETKE